MGHSSSLPDLAAPNQRPRDRETCSARSRPWEQTWPEDGQQKKCVGAAGFGWAGPGAVTNWILFLNAKQATDNAISC